MSASHRFCCGIYALIMLISSLTQVEWEKGENNDVRDSICRKKLTTNDPEALDEQYSPVLPKNKTKQKTHSVSYLIVPSLSYFNKT